MRVLQASWALAVLAVSALIQGSVVQAESPGLAALQQLPQCAAECIQAASRLSSCEPSDLPCLCKAMSSEHADSVSNCVMAKCTVRESLFTHNATQKACGQKPRDVSKNYTIVAIVFTIISSIAVVQRFAIKLWLAKLSIGLDDWCILGTALCQLPCAVIGVAGGVANGLGRDIWNQSFTQITDFGRFLYIYIVLYFASAATLKLAFLFFYLRIFPGKIIRRLLWITIGITVLYGIAFVFTALFQCMPISYFWVRWDQEHVGTCANANGIAWSNGAISIAIDFWMMAIPFSQLWRLQLDWKRKLGVFLMLSVGLLVTVVSIIRLPEIIMNPIDDLNATWTIMNLALWSTVEINVGIICACMPSLRLLLDLVFRSRSRRPTATTETNALNSGRLFIGGRILGTTSGSAFEPYFAPLSSQTGAIMVTRTVDVKLEVLRGES